MLGPPGGPKVVVWPLEINTDTPRVSPGEGALGSTETGKATQKLPGSPRDLTDFTTTEKYRKTYKKKIHDYQRVSIPVCGNVGRVVLPTTLT